MFVPAVFGAGKIVWTSRLMLLMRLAGMIAPSKNRPACARDGIARGGVVNPEVRELSRALR